MNLTLPKKHLKSFYWRDYIIIVLGLVLFSIGYVGFLIPYKVVTGGLGGIALLVKYATGAPLWITMISVNAILLSFVDEPRVFRALGQRTVESRHITRFALGR